MAPLDRWWAISRGLGRHPRYAAHLVARKTRQYLRTRRAAAHPSAPVPPPLGYDLVLTWRCNLRCRMCFEWGDTGWCHDLHAQGRADELPFATIERLAEDTRGPGRFFVLFGGEPMLHSRFDDIVGLLRKRRRFANVCTNGTLLHNHLGVIRSNPYLTFVVSVDGLEPATDAIRGRGIYQRVVSNIAAVKSLRGAPYVGVECTVMPDNVATLTAFCREMARLGVDWVVLNLAWSLTPAQAERYRTFATSHFNVDPISQRGFVWKYSLDREMFIDQFEQIRRERWPMQISWMPPLTSASQIHDYLDNPDDGLGHTFCHKQWLRCDVLPTGDVVACKQFPDIVTGTMSADDTTSAWNSEIYRRFRGLIADAPLPVCSRCNALYLYQPRRPIL